MQVEVLVIGGGAAGLLAAIRTAERGRGTLLIEKTPRLGTKILMSGGTRCNITQATDERGIVRAFGRPGPFLHSALAALGPDALLELFHAEGVATKVEETGKIFPNSDSASDVRDALQRRLHRSGCTVALNEPVVGIERLDERFQVVTNTRTIQAEKVVIATGGKSYPGSGTSGDAYAWLTALGHRVVPPRPALTPLTTNAVWVTQLSGVTIADVGVSLWPTDRTPMSTELAQTKARSKKPRPMAETRGSFLFTHFGMSGPAVLDISRYVTESSVPHTLAVHLDFLPSHRQAAVETELNELCNCEGREVVSHAIFRALPRRLVVALLQQCGIDEQLRLAELPRGARAKLVASVKQSTVPLSGARGFAKAEVTAGGVALDEVDSRTMQSKIVPNLFLVGEVLDLDGPIGGYNFQAAFSTAWLAGSSL